MTETIEKSEAGEPPRRRPVLIMLPLAIFAAMAGLFALALSSGDPSKLPSTLIGKPAPETAFPAMEGLRKGDAAVPGFSTADLKTGEPSVVNFFASWCVPCVQEHPVLTLLAEQAKVRIFGVNYKDPSPGGRRYLGRYGDPYAAVGTDDSGRAAIDWGVYGMPETFIVTGDGRIAMKWVGPITPEVMTAKIIPAIEAARKSGKSG